MYRKDPRLCSTPRCSNNRAPSRKICHKHKARREKERNLVGYTFDRLKQNAKRRGKVFTIDLAYFKILCARTGYLDTKGRRAYDMSLDRIVENRGYEPGNLRVIKLCENVRKRYVDYWQRSYQQPPETPF